MTCLVFLHGFMGAADDWQAIRAELAEFPTAAVELRPAADWSSGVDKLLAELPPDAVLIGYSMGARLALACVLASPERFAGLVFVSGSPGIEDAALRRARDEHDRQVAENLRQRPRASFLQVWYRQSVFASLTPALREAEIERKLARCGRHWPDLLRTYSVGRQPNYWPQLPGIPIPVLAMAGELDPRYVRNMERFALVCARCESCIVPNAGHLVPREQPEAFVQAVREFVRVRVGPRIH